MKSRARWAVALLSLLAVVTGVLAGVAHAQGAPQMQLQVDAATVGVGEVLRLRLTATSGSDMPGDPSLGPAQGFSVHGQNAFPQQTFFNINGQQSNRYTLSVTWTLRAERVGTFRIAPSVVVAGTRYPSRPITIAVVPAGQGPPRAAAQPQLPPAFRTRFNFSPFDPWKGFTQSLDPFDMSPAAPPEVPVDPKLSLESGKARAPRLLSPRDDRQDVGGRRRSRDPEHLRVRRRGCAVD